MPRRKKPAGKLNESQEWMEEHLHLSPQEALEVARQRWPDIKLTRIHAWRHQLKQLGYEFAPGKAGGLHPGKKSADSPPAPAGQLTIPAAEAPVVKERRSRKGEQVVLPLGALSTDEADYMSLVLGIGYNRAARLLAQFRTQFFQQIKAHTNDEE